MNALKTRGVLGGKVLDKWSLHAVCSSLAQVNPQQQIINHNPPLFFREFDWCASCCGWTQGKDTGSFVADYLSFSSKLWSMWFKFTTIPVVRKMKNQLVYNYKSDMQWKLALLIFVLVCWGKHCTIPPPYLVEKPLVRTAEKTDEKVLASNRADEAKMRKVNYQSD